MSNQFTSKDLLPQGTGLTLLDLEKSEQGWVVRGEGRASAALDRIFQFLKVDAVPIDTRREGRNNDTSSRLSQRLEQHPPRNDAQERLWQVLMTSMLRENADANVIGEALGFGDEDKQGLANRFREDVRQLRQFLDLPIEEWRPIFS